jgi:hypothetical protein
MAAVEFFELQCLARTELDLSAEIGATLSLSNKKGRRYYQNKNATTTTYIGSGLWRDVWSIETVNNPSFDDNNNNVDTVVLKMMKPGT